MIGALKQLEAGACSSTSIFPFPSTKSYSDLFGNRGSGHSKECIEHIVAESELCCAILPGRRKPIVDAVCA
jgi:hypothetical protein